MYLIKVSRIFVLAIVLFAASNAYSQKNSTIKHPPITPKWIIGHVVWEDSINTQTAALSLVKQYKEHNIPVDGIIIDSPWEMSYNDFNWDNNKYPEPLKMIESFKKDDVKVILWLTGCINNAAEDVPLGKSPDFDFVVEQGFAVNNGKTSEWWKGEGVHLDFTNPAATAWWDSKLDKVFVDGVYGWKVDQGEYTFGDSLSLTEENRILGEDNSWYGDSLTTSKGRISMYEFKHAYYDHMFDYATSRKPEGMTMARAYSHQGGLAASINKLSIAWNGDFEGNYEGLKLQIYTIYKSAKEGFGAIGCEVGGFYYARSNKAQLIRYAQFASMTGFMNNGGANGAFTNHLPWYHDGETVDIYRFYVTLHQQLSPYIFSIIVDAHLNGGSMLKNINDEEESHTIGNNIFYKAITSDENTVSFNLPAQGDWIDFWSNKKHSGGSLITKEYSIVQSPIFIRSGAIIPLEVNTDVTGLGDESFKGKTVVLIYPDGKSNYVFHKPLGDGIEYSDIKIQFNKNKIKVNSDIQDSFIFLVMSDKAPEAVMGSDNWVYKTEKRYTQIEKNGKKFKLQIK